MANIRILADNAAERATITPDSQVGAFVATNLVVGKKSFVWRASSTVSSLALVWPSAEVVSCVAMLCNGSQNTILRVRGYSDSAGTTLVLDTGNVGACPTPSVKLRGFTAAQAASAYAYGGGALARAFFTPTTVRKLVIDLSDSANLQTYIEATCLMVGAYWEALKNADYGANAQPMDTTVNYRTDAGDLLSQQRPRHAKLSVPMNKLDPTDSANLWDIVRANGIGYPLFVSLFPNDTDAALERRHHMICKLVATPVMALPSFRITTATLEFESV